MNKTMLLLFAVFLASQVQAKVKLPAIISNNMVLQQKSKVNLWGWAEKNSKIKVVTSWDRKEYSTSVNSNGEWKITVKTPQAGGPFSVSFNDGEELLLENVLIGEVWVCSGQSNMEMPMVGFKNQEILNSESIIESASNPNLRLFTVKRDFSTSPKDNCSGNWEVSAPKSASTFSALAFQYGQMLQKKLGIPVGLIQSAWGGTPVRSWMGEGVKDFPDMMKEQEKFDHRSPSALYNAMIAPITPYGIRGFLWYQGEADVRTPELYKKMFPQMVEDWRNKWDSKKLPFYFVQIAPWIYQNDKQTAPYLREVQLSAAKDIPNAAIVITADIGSDKTIHPKDKTTIATRLVNCALAKTYGNKEVAYAGPEFRKLELQGNKALLSFDHASSGLVLKGQNSANFEIAGADKVFHPAKVALTPKGIEVYSEAVQKPVAVRYAFKNYMVGDLFNKDGLPASPFRTDNW